MRKTSLFLCLLLMISFKPLQAQKSWSLEECITYALENNLQIKRQELSVQYNQNNHNQSYFNTLPNMNGQLNFGHNAGKTIDYSTLEYINETYWAGTMALNSSVTLFGGFQIINNIMKTKYDFLRSQSDL